MKLSSKKIVLSILAVAATAGVCCGATFTYAALQTTKDMNRETTVKRLIYLDVSNMTNWENASARMSVYVLDGGDNTPGFVGNAFMESIGNHIYRATFPTGYNKVIFSRHNPSGGATPSWDSRWNQTVDITVDGSKNKFSITSGTYMDYNGSWGTYSTYNYSAS